jgi:hypothetical protein
MKRAMKDDLENLYPRARKWIKDLQASSKTAFGQNELIIWLWISWVFDDNCIFAEVTKRIVKHFRGEFWPRWQRARQPRRQNHRSRQQSENLTLPDLKPFHLHRDVPSV